MKRFLLFLTALIFSATVAHAEVRPLSDVAVTCDIADVSTAGSCYIPAPTDGQIVEIKTILYGAITVANATVTATIAGTAISGCTITVAQSGSAAGDVDSCTISSLAASGHVAEGQSIAVTTDGGSTTAAELGVVVIIRR